MGIHTKEGSRDMRVKHAHLDKAENGDIIARYYDFVYCFIGNDKNLLTLKGETIIKHPIFKGIEAFEGWCMRYYAEHEI